MVRIQSLFQMQLTGTQWQFYFLERPIEFELTNEDEFEIGLSIPMLFFLRCPQ